jgi:ATP-binding cassette, subfamily F, member 1
VLCSDLNAVLWLEEFLSTRWSGTVLTVSHDADFIDAVCTDVIHLDSHRLTGYNGAYAQFEKMRHQIEARKAREFDHQQKVIKELRAGNSNLTVEKAERKAMQKLDVRFLLEKPKPYVVNFAIRAAEDGGSCGGGISVRGVDFGYSGQPLLFRNLNFHVDAKSRVAIVGVNGAGKSTLLALLMKKLQPNAGPNPGRNGLEGEVHQDRRLRVGCYHQHFDELLPYHLTPVAFLESTYNIPEAEVSALPADCVHVMCVGAYCWHYYDCDQTHAVCLCVCLSA